MRQSGLRSSNIEIEDIFISEPQERRRERAKSGFKFKEDNRNSMAELKTSHKIGAIVVLTLLTIGGYFAYNYALYGSPINLPKSSEKLVEQQVIKNDQTTLPSLKEQTPQTPQATEASSKLPIVEVSSISSISLQTTVQQEQVVEKLSSPTSSAPISSPTEQTSQSSTTKSDEIPVSTANELPASRGAITEIVETKTETAATPRSPEADVEFPAGFSDRTEAELADWMNFKQNYRKNYPSREEALKRQAIFLSNQRFIKSFNERQPAPSFSLAVNQFTDLTREETNELFIGPQIEWAQTMQQLEPRMPPKIRILSAQDSAEELSRNSVEELSPQPTIDWRNLTGDPVEQGLCRASSVFAAIANIESSLNKQTALGDNQIKLSEQQLIDALHCIYNGAPNPPPVCFGLASLQHIYELLVQNHIGLVTKQNYDQFQIHRQPNQVCFVVPGEFQGSSYRLASYSIVSETNIDEALLNVGPLSIALDASQPTFHFYSKGIYNEPESSTQSYNFYALLVGLENNQLYNYKAYMVKTSLGKNWGENGHIRLLKDPKRNKCLPQNVAIYPNLA